jgi:hypothetical protein
MDGMTIEDDELYMCAIIDLAAASVLWRRAPRLAMRLLVSACRALDELAATGGYAGRRSTS